MTAEDIKNWEFVFPHKHGNPKLQNGYLTGFPSTQDNLIEIPSQNNVKISYKQLDEWGFGERGWVDISDVLSSELDKFTVRPEDKRW